MNFNTSRYGRLQAACSIAPLGDWAEFGVGEGTTAKLLERYLPETKALHLFDSFEGLPVDGAYTIWTKGKFRSRVFKTKKPNVVVNVGLFEDVLPTYNFSNGLAFVHIDCDLYESTISVLSNIDRALVEQAIIVFDEMFAYPAWEEGEYKALMEWGRPFQWLYKDEKVEQAIIRLI